MENLILVFEKEKTGSRIREIIETASLAQCYLCHSGAEAKRLVYSQNIFCLVCGYKFFDETAESLLEDLPEGCCSLVIAPQNLLELVGNDRIFKLAAPATRGELLASVGTLLQVGRQIEKLFPPRRSAEEQEMIERAKRSLMEQKGLSEEQAHRYLQKKSMDLGTKLTKTAQMVLDGMDNS